jgi:2-oxoglutarate ferredoxin oxidoreductase subunit alpha
VLSAEELESGREFGRYLDVDGDGVPWRTIPGAHPTRGAYFTRGTSRDGYARYTEEGGAYVDNMERLLRKFDTARKLVPRPEICKAGQPTRVGVIHYGSTAASMDEAAQLLAGEGVHVDTLRLRAFPFGPEVGEFIAAHEQVFVVEQNRDAQMRTLLMTDLGIDPAQLVAILHYDGTPVTARFIRREIAARCSRGFAAPRTKEAVS